MLLQYLIENLTDKVITGDTNIDINKIEYNSQKIEQNDIFVAIKGYKEDGNDYIKEAVEKGAVCIVTEDELNANELPNITIVRVQNSRIALSLLASKYYDFPARKLKLIGITGTKGKTTTAYMIRDILNASGKKTGMIGTIYNTYGNVCIEASRTSPESLDLQKLLKDMVDAQMEYVLIFHKNI